MAFLHLTDPAQMRWLTDAEAERWGFVRRPDHDGRSPRPGTSRDLRETAAPPARSG